MPEDIGFQVSDRLFTDGHDLDLLEIPDQQDDDLN